jgi:hypothetical protein
VRSVRLVLRLISLFQFPFLLPFLKELLVLVTELRAEETPLPVSVPGVE